MKSKKVHCFHRDKLLDYLQGYLFYFSIIFAACVCIASKQPLEDFRIFLLCCCDKLPKFKHILTF